MNTDQKRKGSSLIRVHPCLSVVLILLISYASLAQESPYIKKATREETLTASTQAMALAFAPAELKQTPWKIIGPFENKGDTTYPPEREIDLQAEYSGRGGKKVAWKDAPQFIDGRAHSLAIVQPSDYAIFYLYRTIQADRDTPTVLYLGSDDALSVWLNGEKVHEYRGERATTPDEDKVKVRLKRGVNHLLLKVSNLKGGFGFAYRLSRLSPEQEAQLKTWMDELTERLDEDFPGKEAAFYRISSVPIPKDLVLEVGALAFAADGRLVIGTRRGEICFLDTKNNQWSLFASGLHEILGVLVETNGALVVAQRPELTRISDTDGDGKADLFETLTDAFGVSGNYHEYHYGPVRDAAGNYYGTLNLGWEDSGVSWVPYRGWAYELTPKGEFIPYAYGLRSPAGIGISPEGDIFVTDNQGDWWGTSPLLHLTRGAFYGHAASLKWLPDYHGPADPRTIPPEQLKAKRKLPAGWFVFGKLGNSPTEPVWDTTHGKFGPFTGQMFVGDQTKSLITRVALEKVAGEFQGAIFPARAGFASGITRMAFAPDGSLYVGGTDRGWGAIGGRPFALQRVVWTGKVPCEILSMKLMEQGFELTFTKPVDKTAASNPANYSFQHYSYHYWRTYGSPQIDPTPVKVREAKVSPDGLRVALALPKLVTEKVYELHLQNIKAEDGSELAHPDAYYTLNRLQSHR
jgi:hypothetical protein